MNHEYIVLQNGCAMRLGHYHDAPRAGVLVVGLHRATVFPSYEAARNAIRRTNSYADRHRLPWSKKHRPVRLIR